jgi:hypothetical protein
MIRACVRACVRTRTQKSVRTLEAAPALGYSDFGLCTAKNPYVHNFSLYFNNLVCTDGPIYIGVRPYTRPAPISAGPWILSSSKEVY